MPKIHRFPDEVEADLQRYYGVEYTDRWRGRLSIRRLLVLVRGLPRESLFKSACNEELPTSIEADLLMQLWESLSGKAHGRRSAFKDQASLRREAEERKARERLVEQRRRLAREHNARVMARREREGGAR